MQGTGLHWRVVFVLYSFLKQDLPGLYPRAFTRGRTIPSAFIGNDKFPRTHCLVVSEASPYACHSARRRVPADCPISFVVTVGEVITLL